MGVAISKKGLTANGGHGSCPNWEDLGCMWAESKGTEQEHFRCKRGEGSNKSLSLSLSQYHGSVQSGNMVAICMSFVHEHCANQGQPVYVLLLSCHGLHF